jgi:hypothetical protein
MTAMNSFQPRMARTPYIQYGTWEMLLTMLRFASR